MYRRIRSAWMGLLFCAAAAAGGSDAQAAVTLIQAQPLTATASVLYHPVPASGVGTVEHDDTFNSPLTFNPFDPSLGTLILAELTVLGQTQFQVGASIARGVGANDGSILLASNFTAAVQYGAANLDFKFITGSDQICTTIHGPPACLTLDNPGVDHVLDVSFPDISAFQGGAPVVFNLATGISTFFETLGVDPPPIYTVVADATWSGSAELRYIYEPAASPPPAVPEPQTWALMLTGFVGMGAALRRRRATAA